MEPVIDIAFEELVEIAKKLPASKWSKLKAEVENSAHKSVKSKNLESFLLKAPTFTKKQIENIAKTRKAINKWRAK